MGEVQSDVLTESAECSIWGEIPPNPMEMTVEFEQIILESFGHNLAGVYIPTKGITK